MPSRVVFVLLFTLSAIPMVILQSLGLCTLGAVTHYDPYVYGDSCYPWPYGSANNPSSVFGIAPNTPFMTVSGNLLRCGECYEITSNNGSAIFTVVSSCPDCETYYTHFDIRGSGPFNTIIFGNGVGNALVEFKKVACPVNGGIIAIVRDSSQYYLSLVFRNQKYLIMNAEIMIGSSSNWTNMNIDGPGYWSISSYIVSPITVRVTSPYGEMVEIPITSTAINSSNQGTTNFGPPPNTTNDTCQYPVQTVVYDDQLNSMATPYPTGSNWQYVGSPNAFLNFSSTNNPHNGLYCLNAVMALYSTFQFFILAPIPISYMIGINFWVRMDGSLGTGQLQFNLGPFPPQVTIPLTNSWTYVRRTKQTHPRSQKARFSFKSSCTYLETHLYNFHNDYSQGFSTIAFQYTGGSSAPPYLSVYFDDIFLNVTSSPPTLAPTGPSPSSSSSSSMPSTSTSPGRVSLSDATEHYFISGLVILVFFIMFITTSPVLFVP